MDDVTRNSDDERHEGPPAGGGSHGGLDVVRALGEPTRRALYEHVVAMGDWVGRDAAADAVGIARPNAAHHLDRLAADGLLEVDYRRISGRQGPGAGRPAKLYRRSRTQIGVSLPPRDYELAGRLFAEAIDRSRCEGIPVTDSLEVTARAEGHRVAEAIPAAHEGWSDGDVAARREALIDALRARGFEPCRDDHGTIVLRNCPFHHLAKEHTELVCGMNLSLLGAVVDRLDGVGLDAHLEPSEDACCVRLHPVDDRG